jgi:hypothetical protein
MLVLKRTRGEHCRIASEGRLNKKTRSVAAEFFFFVFKHVEKIRSRTPSRSASKAIFAFSAASNLRLVLFVIFRSVCCDGTAVSPISQPVPNSGATSVDARRTRDFSKLPPKALVVTLDDGHRSNSALKDVLERHNIPITIFLCSGLIGTHRRFWFLHEKSSAVVQRLKTVPDDERLAVLRRAGFEEAKESGTNLR